MRNRIRAFISFILSLVCLSATGNMYAQSDDFATWTSAKVNYKLTPSWKLSGMAEFRSKDHMKEADRIGMNVGVGYTVVPRLQLEAAYEVHYRNRGEDGWKFRHRYNAGVQGSLKWQHFTFSLRERFQQTFFEGDIENRLRSRLKVAYSDNDWFVQPYFSAELYQPIGDRPFFRVARMRYRPGIQMDLSQMCSLDVFYCRQYEPDKCKNIVGLEFAFDF